VQVAPDSPALLLTGGDYALPAGLKICGEVSGVQQAGRATRDVPEGRRLLGPEPFSTVAMTYA
jgi:hypothetical protein